MNKGILFFVVIGFVVDELLVFVNGMCIIGFLWIFDFVYLMGFLVKYN